MQMPHQKLFFDRIKRLLLERFPGSLSIVADVDTEVSDEEAKQTSISYITVSTAGTEKDDDGKTIDLTDEEEELLSSELSAESVESAVFSAFN